jgi:hypothetical protein
MAKESAAVHSLEDIHDALKKAPERPLYVYKIPKELAELTGVVTVGLVELNPNELLAAQRRAGDDRGALMFELVKESWRQINGKYITTGDGSADLEWSRSEAGWTKLRTLLSSAHAKIHNPTKADDAGFLASESVQVGR